MADPLQKHTQGHLRKLGDGKFGSSEKCESRMMERIQFEGKEAFVAEANPPGFPTTWVDSNGGPTAADLSGWRFTDKSKLPALILTPEEQHRLETLQASRVAPVREAERARILLQYHAGNSPSAIPKALGISRVTIYHCLHKALEMGMEAGLTRLALVVSAAGPSRVSLVPGCFCGACHALRGVVKLGGSGLNRGCAR